MTDAPDIRRETGPETRLWTRDGFREDPWRHADMPGETRPNERLILPLEAFLALDATSRAAGTMGVHLQPGEPVSAIEPFLSDLALVALSFPAFSDGRSYSKAEHLRRLGFVGTLRATGDVLIDQIPHMLRTGFDEFEVRNPTALARLAEGRVGGIEQHYQPTIVPSAAGEAYSWRRRA